LPLPPGMSPWEPWPPKLASALFLQRLGELGDAIDVTDALDDISIDDTLAQLAEAFSQLPEARRRRSRHIPTGRRELDTLVQVEADDGSQIVEGVVVDGERNDTGSFYFDDHFVVFTTIDTQRGELIRCNGANCHVEIL
jgi:hypothetical protein